MTDNTTDPEDDKTQYMPATQLSGQADSTGEHDSTGIEETQHSLGDRYTLQWIVGRGGMSTVWLAYDNQLAQEVAIKVLNPEFTNNSEFRHRFQLEAQAAESIHAPHVVATYDYGERMTNGAIFCYIVMEYVRGESLADVLAREKVLPEKLALDVIEQTALGLEAIHSQGLVHRDIKPGNILITPEGQIKITDFGITKAASSVPLTRTGMVVGTAQYVSPEQAQGSDVTPASDVYSLGVVGYEMLAGHRPFRGESTVAIAIKHIREVPVPLNDTVSPHTRELVGICLRKDPDLRYANGGELAVATDITRNGERPPQPKNVPAGTVSQGFAETELGTLTDPEHMGPPPQYGPSRSRDSATPITAEQPAISGTKRRSSLWWLAALLIVLLGGLALGLIRMNLNNQEPEPEHPPVTITETTTSTSTPTVNQPTLIQTPTSELTTTVEPSEEPESQRPSSSATTSTAATTTSEAGPGGNIPNPSANPLPERPVDPEGLRER